MSKLNEWIEYRKNKKTAKREIAKIMAATLPTINSVTSNATDIAKVFVSVTESCKNTPQDELVSTAITTIADKFEEDESRVYEIVKYITTLSPTDINKILVDATVETMDK